MSTGILILVIGLVLVVGVAATVWAVKKGGQNKSGVDKTSSRQENKTERNENRVCRTIITAANKKLAKGEAAYIPSYCK